MQELLHILTLYGRFPWFRPESKLPPNKPQSFKPSGSRVPSSPPSSSLQDSTCYPKYLKLLSFSTRPLKPFPHNSTPPNHHHEANLTGRVTNQVTSHMSKTELALETLPPCICQQIPYPGLVFHPLALAKARPIGGHRGEIFRASGPGD